MDLFVYALSIFSILKGESGRGFILRLLEKESFPDSNLLVLKLNVSQNKIALL